MQETAAVLTGWRRKLYEVIFEAETPAGKAFDVALVGAILLSVVTVMLDSIHSVAQAHGRLLTILEWAFTLLFTVEYLLRLLCIGRPVKYAVSFYGVVDLMAVLPTYIGLLFPGGHYLLAVRVLRVLRVFRVLKLAAYLREAELLLAAFKASRRKILVFLLTVLSLVVVLGSLMYLIEGPTNGYTSIPKSIYWAIVTLTTVGYGDITPHTAPGQALACLIMILGYSILAVPSGIVTSELLRASKGVVSARACPQCSAEGHDSDATFCKYCGSPMAQVNEGKALVTR